MSAPSIARSDMQRNTETPTPSQQDIATLAYQLWQNRGSTGGTAEQDWSEAESQLRNLSQAIMDSGRR